MIGCCAHPKTLAGMSKLLSLLLDTDFTVENPFLWKTRTDTVLDLKAAKAADLIPYTVSCSHTRGMTTGYPHCGCCSQCIDRRFAILAAGCGQHDPVDSYQLNVLTDGREKTEDRAMLERYLGFAAKAETIQDEAAFFAEFPEAYRTVNAMDGDRRESAKQVVALCNRHGEQVNGVIDRALAEHLESKAIRRGELPDSCAIMLAAHKLALGPKPKESEETEEVPAEDDEAKRPRCAPMPRTEIARRLLNREKARARDAQGMMERHGLRHEDGNRYTICIDRLNPEDKKRLLKPVP